MPTATRKAAEARSRGVRRWDATADHIEKRLLNLFKRMRANNVRIDRPIEVGDGTPVIVWFDRDNRRFKAVLGRFQHPLDNLNGIMLALHYQYQAFEIIAPSIQEIEEWRDSQRQTRMWDEERTLFLTAFAGYVATPDDVRRTLLEAGDEWWKVLQVSRSASIEEIGIAYKALSRELHPDILKDDGTAFKRLHEAYRAGIDAATKRKVA